MSENLENNLNLNIENKENQMQKPLTFREELFDFLKDLIIIIWIVLVVRSFVILPFQISGQSMYDSYYDKEFIFVDRFSYNFLHDPKRWDVGVFITHMEWKEYFIKRIVWTPGDTLKIASGSVFLQTAGTKEFVELDEKYLSDTNYKATYVRGDSSEKIYTVPEGSYFVMWDNRNASTDSRACFSSCEYGNKTNYIVKSDITGKILLDLGYFHFTKKIWPPISYSNLELWIDTKPKWFSSPSSFEYK